MRHLSRARNQTIYSVSALGTDRIAPPDHQRVALRARGAGMEACTIYG